MSVQRVLIRDHAALSCARRHAGLKAMDRVGLECLLGDLRMLIPMEWVARVIDYRVTGPLPLAAPFVSGLGAVDKSVVVSLRLDGETATGAPGTASRDAKGVLLEGSEEGGVGWVVEVTRVGSFVRADVGPARVAGLPPWARAARTGDGRAAVWVDAPAMIDALGARGEVLA